MGPLGFKKWDSSTFLQEKKAPFSQTTKDTILENFVIKLQKQVFVCHKIKFQLKTNTDKEIRTYNCGKFVAPLMIRRISSIQSISLLFLSQSTQSKYLNFYLKLISLYAHKYAYVFKVKTVIFYKCSPTNGYKLSVSGLHLQKITVFTQETQVYL